MGMVTEKPKEEAKRHLLPSQVLVHYNPELPLILACDASTVGTGSVVSAVMLEINRLPDVYALYCRVLFAIAKNNLLHLTRNATTSIINLLLPERIDWEDCLLRLVVFPVEMLHLVLFESTQ